MRILIVFAILFHQKNRAITILHAWCPDYVLQLQLVARYYNDLNNIEKQFLHLHKLIQKLLMHPDLSVKNKHYKSPDDSVEYKPYNFH